MKEGSVEITLGARDEKLINTLNHSERGIRTFGERSINSLRRTGDAVKTFSDKYIGAMAGIGMGIGIVAATKDLMQFEGVLKQIRRTGGYTVEDLAGLRDQIIGLMDPAKKIPLNKDDWAEMAKEMHDTGLSLGLIRRNLEAVGRGDVASHTAPGVYASAIGELLDKYRVAERDLPQLQEQINAALKFPDVRKDPEAFLKLFANLSKQMQIVGAYGMKNVTPLMAVLAEFTQKSSSPGEAGSSLEALLTGLFRLQKAQDKLKPMKAAGIEFFDKKGMKDIGALLPEFKKWFDLIDAHGGNVETAAMSVFGKPGAGQALMMIAKNYEEIVGKQRTLNTSTGGLARDFNINTGGMTAQLKAFQNQLDRFKVEHLTGPLKLVTRGLTELNSHPVFTNVALYTLLAALGIGVAGKIGGMAKGGFDFFRNMGKGGGASGLPGTGGGMGIPVYVTNFPGSFKGGAPPLVDQYGRPIPASGGLGETARTASIAAALPSLIPLVVGATATYMMLSYMDRPDVKAESARRRADAAAVDDRMKGATSKVALGETPYRSPINIELAVNIQPGRTTALTNSPNVFLKVAPLTSGDFLTWP